MWSSPDGTHLVTLGTGTLVERTKLTLLLRALSGMLGDYSVLAPLGWP